MSFGSTEIGYFLTDKLLYRMGLSFYEANIVYVSVVLLFVMALIVRYTPNINVAASLYMGFPLLMNGIQIRNALCSIIIMFGIQFLVEEKKGNTFKYILTVVLAMMFHTTALFYLSFVLVKWLNRKKLMFVSSAIAIAVLPLVGLASSILRVLVGASRYDGKFLSYNSLLECTVAAFWIISSLFLITEMIKDASKRNFNKKLGNTLIGINTVSVILIPLFFIDFSFERLFRNWVVYTYCGFANYIIRSRRERDGKYYFYTISFLLWYVFSIIVFEMMLGDRLDGIVKVYMSANAVFENPVSYSLVLALLLYVTVMLLAFELSGRKIKWNMFSVKVVK
jgi:uncharacterized membrane protein YqjE